MTEEQAFQMRVAWQMTSDDAPVRALALCVIQEGPNMGLPAFHVTLADGGELTLVLPEDSARRLYLGAAAAFGGMVDRVSAQLGALAEEKPEPKARVYSMDDLKRMQRP